MEDNIINRIDHLLRHIHGVSSNCNLLGKKLIMNGEEEFGRILISMGLTHDHSKFFGIEWETLTKNAEDFTERDKLGVFHHKRTNRHHPEFWGGIDKMPDIHIAEMVCDWKARSNEFGTNLREWIDEDATRIFGFTKDDEIYKKIDKFLNLLLDKPFNK